MFQIRSKNCKLIPSSRKDNSECVETSKKHKIITSPPPVKLTSPSKS